MGSIVRYHAGGFVAAAPQQNRAELFDGATATYTAWSVAGAVTATRPLTTAEADDLAAMDTALTVDTNRHTIQQQAAAALANNATFINSTATQRQTNRDAQILALTRQMNGLIRLAIGQLDATT